MKRWTLMMWMAMFGAAVMALPAVAQDEVAQEEAAQEDAEQANDVTVQPVALQIASQALNEDIEGLMSNLNAGTTVTVFLRSPEDKQFVEIDERASEIASFTDAEDNDLMEQPDDEGESNQFNQYGIGSFPRISNDGSVAMIELTAPRTPARGSSNVNVTGTLVVNVASGTSSETIENAQITEGALNVPGHEIEITGSGPSDWDPDTFSIQVQTTRETDKQLAEVRFLDENGEPIETRGTGTSRMGETVNLSYMFAEEIDSATIEFVFHEGLETIDVDVELEVSMGL